MAPRRRAVKAAAESGISADPLTFASLPLPLAQRVFLALPADARGRASCVCRAWRDVLAEPSLWTRLDMSFVSVRADGQRFAAVLSGAVGRARSQLRQLDLSQRYVEQDVLLPVLTDNAGSLRELHLYFVRRAAAAEDYIITPTVEAVVAAAPLLQVLTAEKLTCTWEEAPRMLRAEPPLALLQMRRSLKVCFSSGVAGNFGGIHRFSPFAAALADAALQPALSELCVDGADMAQPALMGALVDAAVARRLRQLALERCTPPAAAAVARLLAQGSLTALDFSWSLAAPFDAAGAAVVADALRANSTLTELLLCEAQLCLDIDAAGVLLGALVGHPSLRELRIIGERTAEDDCIAFGAAVAALIAADAPALQVLVCFNASLGDDGLAPIVESLPLNRHLRELDLSCNDISEEFARERLLPAVRANTTLCKLIANHEGDEEPVPAATEAEELVHLRGQHS